MLLTLILIVALWVTSQAAFSQEEPPIVLKDTINQAIPPNNLPLTTGLTVAESVLIAEATVSMRVEHERVEDLDVFLIPPNAIPIPLLRHNALNETTSGVRRFVFDFPDQLDSGSLKPLSASDAKGLWQLSVSDALAGNNGALLEWAVEIAPAMIAQFEIKTPTQLLRVAVDGYGSFGDQGNQRDSNLGGKYRAPVDEANAMPASTTFHSALYMHSAERYLTSLDMLPGKRLPGVPLTRLDDGSIESRFSINSIDVTLNQRLAVDETQFFALIQQYRFSSEKVIRLPFVVSRYLNPKFVDAGAPSNYAVVRRATHAVGSLAVFDEIQNATSDQSRFIEIENINKAGDQHNYAVSLWFENNAAPNFAERLLTKNLRFFEENNPRIILDNNNDNVTDPRQGFDVAVAQAESLSFDEVNQATLTAITRWGFSSPAELLSSTKSSDSLLKKTPAPVKESPTPAATHTPTPNAPTPGPVFLTPTPIASGLQIEGNLPDLRLLAGQPEPNIIDLNALVHDNLTPNEALSWQIVQNAGLPFSINAQGYLSCGAINTPGVYEGLVLQVSNGRETLWFSSRVKVSTARLRSSPPIPPITLGASEDTYTSAFRLNELIEEAPILSEENSQLQWRVNPTLPPGVESVEIHNDTRFTVKVNENFSGRLRSLPLMVQRVTFTLTPAATPSFTPSPTPQPPVVTPSFTPTPTSTLTPSPPSMPARSPTPTLRATPISNCASKIHLAGRLNLETELGPYEWKVKPAKNSNTTHLYMAHFDEGTIGLYTLQGQTPAFQGAWPAGFGVTNIALSDVNQDGVDDLVVLNPILETLSVFFDALNPKSRADVQITLDGERIPNPESLVNVSRFQALAAGASGLTAGVDIVVRMNEALLIYAWQNGDFMLRDQIAVDGRTRFLNHADLDQDGDMDLLTGIQRTSGNENQGFSRLLLFENVDGDYQLRSILPIDQENPGNSARQVVTYEGENQSNLDLVVLTFNGSLQFYRSQEGLNYTRTNNIQPFPPGLTRTVATGELTGDNRPELAAMHISQEGVTLFVLCGETLLGNVEMAAKRITTVPISGELFDLKIADLIGDNALEVVFTQSLRDRMQVLGGW